MVKRAFYVLATAALIAGLAYATFMTPRPCGMDDILSSCGSGARWGTVLSAVTVSLILFYVGRALGGNRNP